MGFPESLAQTANAKGKSTEKMEIKFRNYHKYVSKDTLDVLGQTGEEGQAEQISAEIIQEVTRVERMYDRKVAKAIKQQLKNENDPIACLRPIQANIDLKRSLETKLSHLQVKSDKSILEILSKCCFSYQPLLLSSISPFQVFYANSVSFCFDFTQII